MNSPVVQEDENREIPSLLIPLASCKLVLPTVSVAEMIPHTQPQPQKANTAKPMPAWFLGYLLWRGTEVPMVSYEYLNGGDVATTSADSQVLILNNTGVSADLPFFCMPTQGIPRLSRVAVNEISENADAAAREYDAMCVSIAGEQAVIPDVNKIERACAKLLGLTSSP